MPMNSIARLVATEVRWLLDKPYHEAGDVNEAAKRVISLSSNWPLTLDRAVEMITEGVIAAIEKEKEEQRRQGIEQNKLDQLAKLFS